MVMTDRPKPVIEGFIVEWDPLQHEWLARSSSGNYTIRGRTQDELEGRRWDLYGQVLAQFRSAIAEVFPHKET